MTLEALDFIVPDYHRGKVAFIPVCEEVACGESETSVNSPNRYVVKELIQELILAGCLGPQEWSKAHRDAKRSPHSFTLSFGGCDLSVIDRR